MLKKENLKSYIDELIKEIEEELKESNVTGNVDGYQTPFAFSDKKSSNKRKKTATQLGYTIVNNDINNIDESIITEKQFKGLEGIPSTTSLEKISDVQKLKIVKGVGNIIDFKVPKGVSRNFWQVIGTGKVKKNLAGEHYLEGKVINSPMFKSLDALLNGINWKSMEERRRFNEGVITESWDVKDGKVLYNGKLIGYYEFDRDSDSFWVDDVKKGKGQLSFDTKNELISYFKKYTNDALKSLSKMRFKESVSESKELKWQDVEVGDAANVKSINKTGLVIKTYGRKFHLKFPNGTTKTYDANELTFVKNESVNEATTADIIKDLDKAKNDLLKKVDVLVAKKKKLYSNVDIESPMTADEKKLDKDIADLFSQINSLVLQKRKIKESVSEGKVKRPVNRWLELKNDETMHANKKLATGLRELKYQLSEVEKFFRWYNQIKTMNELSSDSFWKRTHGHIYKIKERLINIAKTIQEIEK